VGAALTFNNANQVTSSGYSYDGGGNRTASPTGTAGYNTAGQATTTTKTGVTGTNSYVYAGTSQAEPVKENTTTGDVYTLSYGRTDRSGLPEIEQVKVNTLTGYVLHDPSGLPVMIQTNSQVMCLYMYDGRDNPVLLATNFNTVSYALQFDPYGAATQTAGTTTNGGWILNPYTFGGGLQDRATGLVKFGGRWYDPGTGTWTQQDTYNAPLDPNNGNRYAYAGGDPINRTDPTGRDIYSDLGELSGSVVACVESGTVAGAYGAAVGSLFGPEGTVGGAVGGFVYGCGFGIISENTLGSHV